MIDADRTLCEVCMEANCICTIYKCPCGKLETNCTWPEDALCPCRVCDELQANCSCHNPLEDKE